MVHTVMAETRRLVFSFDERSYDDLTRLAADGNFATVHQAVRTAIHITRGLQSQAQDGYSELVVRDPRTKSERILVIPGLCPIVDDNTRHAGRNDGKRSLTGGQAKSGDDSRSAEDD